MMALISLLQSYVNYMVFLMNKQTFSAYEKFETFQGSEGMNMNDYIIEFEQLNKKRVTYKIELPSAVHAYQLLKNANLPKGKRDLA